MTTSTATNTEKEPVTSPTEEVAPPEQCDVQPFDGEGDIPVIVVYGYRDKTILEFADRVAAQAETLKVLLDRRDRCFGELTSFVRDTLALRNLTAVYASCAPEALVPLSLTEAERLKEVNRCSQLAKAAADLHDATMKALPNPSVLWENLPTTHAEVMAEVDRQTEVGKALLDGGSLCHIVKGFPKEHQQSDEVRSDLYAVSVAFAHLLEQLERSSASDHLTDLLDSIELDDESGTVDVAVEEATSAVELVARYMLYSVGFLPGPDSLLVAIAQNRLAVAVHSQLNEWKVVHPPPSPTPQARSIRANESISDYRSAIKRAVVAHLPRKLGGLAVAARKEVDDLFDNLLKDDAGQSFKRSNRLRSQFERDLNKIIARYTKKALRSPPVKVKGEPMPLIFNRDAYQRSKLTGALGPGRVAVSTGVSLALMFISYQRFVDEGGGVNLSILAADVSFSFAGVVHALGFAFSRNGLLTAGRYLGIAGAIISFSTSAYLMWDAGKRWWDKGTDKDLHKFIEATVGAVASAALLASCFLGWPFALIGGALSVGIIIYQVATSEEPDPPALADIKALVEKIRGSTFASLHDRWFWQSDRSVTQVLGLGSSLGDVDAALEQVKGFALLPLFPIDSSQQAINVEDPLEFARIVEDTVHAHTAAIESSWMTRSVTPPERAVTRERCIDVLRHIGIDEDRARQLLRRRRRGFPGRDGGVENWFTED